MRNTKILGLAIVGASCFGIESCKTLDQRTRDNPREEIRQERFEHHNKYRKAVRDERYALEERDFGGEYV